MIKKLKNLLVVMALMNIYTALAQSQPNVLLIITDDHRADAVRGVNRVLRGQPNSDLGYVSSPEINKLIREGVLFVQAYCNSPACAPSRASMITGLYPSHNGIYGFESTHNEVSTFKKVLPEVMKEQGYQTSRFGKSGVGIFPRDRRLRRSFSFYDFDIDFRRDLREHGFTDYYKDKQTRRAQGDVLEHFYTNANQTTFSLLENTAERRAIEAQYDILRARTRQSQDLIIGGVSPRNEEETSDGFMLQEYMKYFDNANRNYTTFSGRNAQGADTSKPQYVNLGFHVPHTPVLPPARFRNRFNNRTYNIPDFDRAFSQGNLPPQLNRLYDKMKIDGLTNAEKQQAIRDYYAFCAYADFLIGKAANRFKEYSEANGQEYLIVLVVGDHGWHLGEQGIEAKFAPYRISNEGAMVIVSSDKSKFPERKKVRDFVEYVDIAPTIYTAAGVNVNAPRFQFLDGYDLEQVHKRQTNFKRDYVLGEMNHVYGPRAYLRTKDFAFSMRTRRKNNKPSANFAPNEEVRWGLEAPINQIEPALFDLRVDPGETVNLANDPAYVELTAAFRTKLANIVLGDGRLEVDWSQQNRFNISNFAEGSDDKKIRFPNSIIPTPSNVSAKSLNRIKSFKNEDQEPNIRIKNNELYVFVNENGVYTINIYDINGKNIFADKLLLKLGESNHIEVNTILSGAYIITLVSEEVKLTKKLVL